MEAVSHPRREPDEVRADGSARMAFGYQWTAPWWNSGASHMNAAFRKAFFDRLGLVSLLDTVRRLQCLS
jgi:hypothetical protein